MNRECSEFCCNTNVMMERHTLHPSVCVCVGGSTTHSLTLTAEGISSSITDGGQKRNTCRINMTLDYWRLYLVHYVEQIYSYYIKTCIF